MKFRGALVKEQGIKFGIAIVKQSVLHSTDREQVRLQFAQIFKVPTVLMAQDSRNIPEYYGRQDIVDFLANVSIVAIPWREYSLQ